MKYIDDNSRSFEAATPADVLNHLKNDSAWTSELSLPAYRESLAGRLALPPDASDDSIVEALEQHSVIRRAPDGER